MKRGVQSGAGSRRRDGKMIRHMAPHHHMEVWRKRRRQMPSSCDAGSGKGWQLGIIGIEGNFVTGKANPEGKYRNP